MSFSFIQITDHHLGDSETALNRGYNTAWALRRVLAEIDRRERHGADFLLCTGDLANKGLDAEYLFACHLLGLAPDMAVPPGPVPLNRVGLPTWQGYFIPGNHDPRERFCRYLFPGSVPREQLNVAFHHKGVQFLCLDTGSGNRAGVMDQEALEFLDAGLAGGQETVVIMHHHPIPVGIPWLDRALPEGGDRFWQIIRARQVLGVLFGHAHATVEAEVAGVPVLGLRSTNFQFAPAEQPLICIQPLHYRVVTVAEGCLTSEIVEISLL